MHSPLPLLKDRGYIVFGTDPAGVGVSVGVKLLVHSVIRTDIWNVLMVLGRNVERTRRRTRMTTLPFLLLASYPFVIFDSDYALISCPLCKSNIFWNTFMILGRNREQDNTTCRVQKCQIWLSYFWSYLPSFCLKMLSCLQLEYPLKYLDSTWQKCRTGLDDV